MIEEKFNASEWHIEDMSERHKDEMSVLFARIFSQEMSSELWAWKYAEGRGCGIGVWRAGEMVAHFGGLVRFILLKGEMWEGVQIVDVMVDAGGRRGVSRKGAFFHAAATFFERYVGVGKRFLFGYGFPNYRHFKVGEKLKLYEKVDQISLVCWPALQARPSLTIRLRRIGREGVCPQIGEKIDALWRAMAEDLRESVVGIRDWAYIQHRYLQHPTKKYHLMLATGRLSGKVVGLIVARPEMQELFLLDVIAPLKNFSVMIHLARRLAAGLGLASLHTWITASHLQPFMVQGGEYHETDIFITNSCWGEGIPAEALRDRWWLTGGDTDFQ